MANPVAEPRYRLERDHAIRLAEVQAESTDGGLKRAAGSPKWSDQPMYTALQANGVAIRHILFYYLICTCYHLTDFDLMASMVSATVLRI